MIERMKKTIVLSSSSRRAELLSSLRDLGIMHITDIVTKSAPLDDLEKRRAEHASVLQTLKERGDKKAQPASGDFRTVHASLMSLLAEEEALRDRMIALQNERERILPLGEFDPEAVRGLADDGIELRLYTGTKKDEAILAASDIRYFPLRYEGKGIAVAILGQDIPEGSSLSPFALPASSLSVIDSEILSSREHLKEIDGKIRAAAAYIPLYEKELRREDEDITFERVSESVGGDDIVYLTGYIPQSDVPRFTEYAKREGLAYSLSDPGPDDNPPTKVIYKGFVRIVKPVFDILGTVPGYNEYDISSYFLVFFSLFFAMIIGDAGYGIIFILAGLAMQLRSRKCTDINILLYVVGAATVVWGAVTGTWFGSLSILERVPFLQRLVIPSIANYPELFGLDASYTQNMLMKFCFMLGTVQLSLARVMNIIRKARERDLSLVAEIGWLMDGILLYFLALNLVIGEPFPLSVVGIGVGTGFVLVCLFSAQGPGVPFVKGMLSSLSGFFTTFLDTISCFSNLMSYIRLFAVGMASLAIAQSFNSMGGGMLGGAAFIVGVIVILLGHVLNLVMGLLSVVVHGVRLNLLEFSGALGMEWAGYNYEPFRKMVQDNE